MQCFTDVYCLNAPFTGCICEACALWLILENLKGYSNYAPFWLFTLSMEHDVHVRCYSVHQPHAVHHHVPEGCVLVLVHILLELTYQSVQMFWNVCDGNYLW
jgi:hypothetical protein